MRLSKRPSSPRTRGRRTVIVPAVIANRRGFPVPVPIPRLRIDGRQPLRLPAAQQVRDLLLQDILKPSLDPEPRELLERRPLGPRPLLLLSSSRLDLRRSARLMLPTPVSSFLPVHPHGFVAGRSTPPS